MLIRYFIMALLISIVSCQSSIPKNISLLPISPGSPFVPITGTSRMSDISSNHQFCKNSTFGKYVSKVHKQKFVSQVRSIKSRKRRRNLKRLLKHRVSYKTSVTLSRHPPIHSSSFPTVYRPEVERWIHYFQNTGRTTFTKWLIRSYHFQETIIPIIKNDGLPEDLIFLAMIESGFNNSAYSKARATGTWQFMSSTAKLYGLKINYWLDERRDPIKSTLAASRYLKDLYRQFNDWHLAIAAYNAGPGKIRRAMRKLKTHNFWKIASSRYIRSETKNYVPKMLAALKIAKDPAKYGFSVENQTYPRHLEVVWIDRPVRISEIAMKLNIPTYQVNTWNPELLRGVTPPTSRLPSSKYPFKIPYSLSEKLKLILPNLAELEIKDVKIHRIRSGETLTYLSKKYKVPLKKIIKMNPKVSPRKLRPGKNIAIPIPAIINSIKT